MEGLSLAPCWRPRHRNLRHLAARALRDRPLTPAAAPSRSTTKPGNGARPERVRPAELQAERSLLGGALLARDPRDILATIPQPAFSLDGHGHIAAAITALHLDSAHVDTVTVASWLTRHGLLERVGGGEYLVELNNTTPSVSGAATYADAILRAWRSWRAVEIADEITLNSLLGGDISQQIVDLNELHAHAGVDELELDDMVAALDDQLLETPTILQRADGHHLLYEAAVNVLHSEPVVGKSMIAMIACAEIIGSGGHVLYLDYEDTSRRVARRMVHTLGISRDQLRGHFHYKRLYTLTPRAVAGLPHVAERLEARLVVIDGMAEALAAQGFDENSGTDVAAWWNTVARPLADTGAAVLALDHVTKSRENRGRWGRGSGHKLAALDGVAYSLDTITAFSRERGGSVKLTIAKDRPACVGATGDIAAVITINPQPDGRIRFSIDAHTSGGEWQGPTDCMAVVRKLFTEHPDLELARSAIASQIKTIYDKGFRDRTVRESADRLALDGILEMFKRGKGTYFRLSPDAHDNTKQHDKSELWEDF